MRLVLERFAHNALALLAVTTILFFMFRLMPGTPLAAFINENLNADQQQAMLEQFGLDKPMWQQYGIYLGNLMTGQMGLSFFQRRPVTTILLEVLPNSIILTLVSLIIAYIFGVLAGVREDRTGEIQLTSGLRELLRQRPIYACEVHGVRHDTGTMLGFLKASMYFALKRGDLRDDLGAYLRSLLEQEPTGQY